MWTYIISFLTAGLLAVITTPIVVRLAHRRGWLDQPSETRKIHFRAVPRLGGVAVCFSFFAPLIALSIYENRVSQILYEDWRLVTFLGAGSVGIVGLGIWDDLRGADARLKLMVQSAVAAAVWIGGFRIELIGMDFGTGPINLGWLSFPLTWLWIVGIVNALNLIDGLDGLASGVALTAAVVLFGVSFGQANVLPCLFMCTLGGALVGFLFFNAHPAKIFLGDSGSMFLGYVLATTSLWTQQKATTALALLVPMLALAVPILDTSLSFLRRLSRRTNPFAADREHLHHRLLALGLSHRSAVATLWVLSLVFALAAVSMAFADHVSITVALAAACTSVVLLLRRIGVFEPPPMWGEEAREMRERVRQVAQRLRAAECDEEAWETLSEGLAALPVSSAQLSWESPPDERPANGPGYRWGRDSSSSRPRIKTRSLDLAEGGRSFGELSVTLRERNATQDLELSVELLRDALIDYASQRRSPAPRVVASVIPLAPEKLRSAQA